MRKRVHIALVVLLLILAGVSVWQGLRRREPVYQGKRLSSWLEAYRLHGVAGVETWQVRAEQQKADEAVRQVGTNALPTLLRMLRAKDSALKVKLIGLAQRQHFVRIKYTPAEELNYRACWSFGVLRAKARSALPALIEIANENICPSRYVVTVLDSVGPSAEEAVPLMLRWATNADPWVRCQAVFALGSLHAEPDRVVPVLTNALHDPSSDVQNAAVRQLGMLGRDARLAVPALVEFLNTSHDDMNKFNATNALKAIDSEAPAKAGVE
jgi:HEAT repeat protein